MASGPITSWQIDGATMETVSNFIFGGSKSLQMVTAAMKLKDAYSLEWMYRALSLSVLYSSFPLASYLHMVVYNMSMLLSQFVSPSPFPHCVHKYIPYVCISIPALQIGS